MRNYWKMLMFILIYGALCFYMIMKESDFLYAMLVWNVILGTVPIFMIRQAGKTESRWKRATFIFLWILFLPNAFYMITDFIHITNHPMVWVIPVELYSGLDGTRYTMDIYLWARLLIISLGAFYALLAAIESTFEFLHIFDSKRRPFRRMLYIFLVSLLSSIGIYIGRFLRYNSWDVLNPFALMKNLIQSVDLFSISFVMIYTGFILITFLIYRIFQNEETKENITSTSV